MTNYGNNMKNVQCYNNIFFTNGNLPFINIPAIFTTENPAFKGNLYWSASGNPKWIYGNNTASTLSDFRNSGTNCEKTNTTLHGISMDPLMEGIGIASPTIFPQTNDKLKYYLLKKNSPAIDKGLNLQTQFLISSGNRDYWGNVTGNSLPDIGANEFSESANYRKFHNTELSVFPNPVSAGYLNIIIPGNLSVEKVELHSITGQTLLIKNCQINMNGLLNIPLDRINAGLYSLIVIMKDGQIYTANKICILHN
jgi:hypothetical protein